GSNGLTCRGDLIDHPLYLGRAGGPVVSVVLVMIVELVQVEFYRSKAHLLCPLSVFRKILGRGEAGLIERGVAIHAYLVAELTAKQLINRDVQCFPRKIPQRRFDR